MGGRADMKDLDINIHNKDETLASEEGLFIHIMYMHLFTLLFGLSSRDSGMFCNSNVKSSG